MKPTNDGGPAFPEFMWDHMEPKRGMTLRDYFAAAALTGLIVADELARQHINPGGTRVTADEYASAAYECADAMLRAREGGAS